MDLLSYRLGLEVQRDLHETAARARLARQAQKANRSFPSAGTWLAGKLARHRLLPTAGVNR